MTPRSYYLIGMLVLLFLANIAMLMGLTNWPQRVRESFASEIVGSASSSRSKSGSGSGSLPEEHFMNYLVPNTFTTEAIGPYDNVNLAANLPPSAQGFRAKYPNEPLAGPPITLDNDHLLIFTNNQCKPECCSSSMSCDGGGCVCTTPDQREFINLRGGNRGHMGAKSDDGF
jgi:hypothetical protein